MLMIFTSRQAQIFLFLIFKVLKIVRQNQRENLICKTGQRLFLTIIGILLISPPIIKVKRLLEHVLHAELLSVDTHMKYRMKNFIFKIVLILHSSSLIHRCFSTEVRKQFYKKHSAKIQLMSVYTLII